MQAHAVKLKKKAGLPRMGTAPLAATPKQTPVVLAPQAEHFHVQL
jgi:hypothetical protein